MITCSPVGTVCTTSVHGRGLPSTSITNRPPCRPLARGSMPAAALSTINTLSPSTRDNGGESAHCSGSFFEPLTVITRGFTHMPSTRWCTWTALDATSNRILPARTTTAPCDTPQAFSYPVAAVSFSITVGSASASPAVVVLTTTSGSRSSPPSSIVSTSMPNRPRSGAASRLTWPDVSTRADCGTFGLRASE
jgi:hypothetical protein